jgi:hypothetical protein
LQQGSHGNGNFATEPGDRLVRKKNRASKNDALLLPAGLEVRP